MKNTYLALAILGCVVPCVFFGNFFTDHGVDLPKFIEQSFATSPASGLTADLLITSVVFWIWSFRESRLRGMKAWWLYVVLNLGIGLSFAMPLFLYFRQGFVESSGSEAELGRARLHSA